jgi:hypothetical protein
MLLSFRNSRLFNESRNRWDIEWRYANQVRFESIFALTDPVELTTKRAAFAGIISDHRRSAA